MAQPDFYSFFLCRKNKKILLAICFAFLVSSINAYKKKNFLWEISSSENKLYILGSVHAVNEATYPLDPVIIKAYEDSDVLAVEVNVLDSMDEDMVRLMMNNGMYESEEHQRQDIPAGLLAKIEYEAEIYGLDPSIWRLMKPWLLATTIMQLKIMNLGFNPLLGIDLYFLNKARRKKKIIELESAQMQIELLNTLPQEIQLLLLEHVLEDVSLFQEEMDKLMLRWQTGDVEGLKKIIHKSFSSNKSFRPLYKKIILDRNITLSRKISELLNRKKNITYFVVIGAGHLVGKDGIIKMLSRDFEVKQL